FALFALITQLLLAPTATSAQQLSEKDAPFYNGLFGEKVKSLGPTVRALAAERANPNATITSITNAINAYLEALLDYDTELAARLGLRMRIANGYYQNAPLTPQQIRSVLLEIDAHLRLKRRKEALQAALPLFALGEAATGFDDGLKERWAVLKAVLLDGKSANSPEFVSRLQSAELARDALRADLTSVLSAYASIRQTIPNLKNRADEVLKITEAVFAKHSRDKPFMADIASIAAWAGFMKQDASIAGRWLAELDNEKPLFFAAMPIHPAGVYSSWAASDPERTAERQVPSMRAKHYGERGYTLLKLQYGERHPEVIDAGVNLAAFFRSFKKDAAAGAMRRHTQTLISDDEKGAANFLLRLGLETTLVEDFEGAERLFSRAFRAKDTKRSDGDKIVEQILIGWADLLVRSQKRGRAKRLYERLIEIDGRKPEGATRASVDYWRLLAVIAAQDGDEQGEALALNEAEELAKRILPPGDPMFGTLEASRILNNTVPPGSSPTLTDRWKKLRDADRPSAGLRAQNDTIDKPGMLVRFAVLSSQLAQAVLDRKAYVARSTLAELKRMVPDRSLFAAGFDSIDGQISLMEQDFETALKHFRRASAAALQPGRGSQSIEVGIVFPAHAMSAIRVAAKLANDDQTPFVEEAFEIIQNSAMLSVGKALSRAQNRSFGDQQADDSLRTAQDIELAISRVRDQLLDAISKGEDTTDSQDRLDDLETQLGALQQGSKNASLDFSRPLPVSIEDTIQHVEPDEGLILIATVPSFASQDERPSLIFTLTRDADGRRIQSYTSTEDRAKLEDISRRLRCQAALTDPACGSVRAATRGVMTLDDDDAEKAKQKPFDFELAYEAYKLLMEPYANTLTERKRLVIIPDKSLVSMPFHLMITSPPDENTTLENAPWLIRKHSVIVVPSVAGFHAFRQRQRQKRDSTSSFFGVGDPLIGRQRNGPLPHDCGASESTPVLIAQNLDGTAVNTRSGTARSEALLDLQELPETRCELQAGAAAAGGENRILLQGDANETAVKRLSRNGTLARYDIVSFATHGLIAGELGQSHAGLVLTPPKAPTKQDDGLLTSAEISTLRLNADFVLLSACNTAAPDRAGQEGLSGMASAFFHAGARSLLVSHWPVYSDAATRLTTGLFDQRRANPGIDKAEAQRLAILSVLNDPNATQRELHPAYWAPFMLVGDNR
ncbi:MAG: CHAT domain-containing protein, partial [Pseudomonadota bacterium]